MTTLFVLISLQLVEGYQVNALQLNPCGGEDVGYGRQSAQPQADHGFFHPLECEPTLQIGYVCTASWIYYQQPFNVDNEALIKTKKILWVINDFVNHTDYIEVKNKWTFLLSFFPLFFLHFFFLVFREGDQ